MKTIIKVSENVFSRLSERLYSNYPRNENGIIIRVNWSVVGSLFLMVLTEPIVPDEEDITIGRGIVRFREPYLVKMARSLGKAEHGIAVIHSHPEDTRPIPSLLDDDMDEYLCDYVHSFDPDVPYLSLIFMKSSSGEITFSVRGHYRNSEIVVDELQVVEKKLTVLYPLGKKPREVPEIIGKRLERLCDSYGPESASKLWNSEVTIVGGGGTGSPSAHSLARSGVGTINIIDYDILNLHNSERVHGSFSRHFVAEKKCYKVDVIRDLIHEINPLIKVNIHKGSVLDLEAKEMILRSHIVLSCTDSEHAKVALSEFVWRFRCIVFQVNVSIESIPEAVTAQILHLTHLHPEGPCLYCMDMVNAQRLAQELMSDEERKQRKEAATKERNNAYWLDTPVVPTVGALATVGGEKVSNFTIGLLTGKFGPVALFSEEDLLSPYPAMHLNPKAKTGCICLSASGLCDQSRGRAILVK